MMCVEAQEKRSLDCHDKSATLVMLYKNIYAKPDVANIQRLILDNV